MLAQFGMLSADLVEDIIRCQRRPARLIRHPQRCPLTSVFFEHSVLQRYYVDPQKYRVKDGSVSCCALWSLQINNDHAECIAMSFCYLGIELPKHEQDHWKIRETREAYGLLQCVPVRQSVSQEFCQVALTDAAQLVREFRPRLREHGSGAESSPSQMRQH